jgi:hypothetical protein
MRRLSIGLLCAVALVLAAAPGLADQASLHDGNDAFGRLDVKRITQGHASNGLLHRIDTYGSFNKGSLSQDGSYIHVLFTTDSDNRPERALVVDVEGRDWIAQMHPWRNGEIGEHVYGRARVTRPNTRSVRLVFKRSLLGSGVNEYGWHVDTQYHHSGHPHCGTDKGVVIVCPDSAPNDTKPYAYLRHQL